MTAGLLTKVPANVAQMAGKSYRVNHMNRVKVPITQSVRHRW